MTLAGSPFCSEGASAVSRHEWGEGLGSYSAGMNRSHAVDGQDLALAGTSR